MRVNAQSRRRGLRLCLLVTAVMTLSLSAAADSAEDSAAATGAIAPDQTVRQMTLDILRKLDEGGHRPAEDSAELYGIVDELLRPYFDFAYASKLVLGRYWKDATPSERDAFVAAFYNYLVRVYSHALLAARDDTLVIRSYRYDLEQDKAVVKTLMRLTDGIEVPVDYRMRATPEGWKIWDVVAQGVSYVKIYRSDFGAIAGSGGVGALNQWLDSQQRKP